MSSSSSSDSISKSDPTLNMGPKRVVSPENTANTYRTSHEAAAAGSTLTGPASTAETPAVPTPEVPGYEIEGVLGRGGMGVVYLARHLALKRPVALKMVLAGGHAGPKDISRFRVEAEAVARLQHPNIVQIHEVGESDGHPYCALEYVEGGSLASKLAGKPLPAREAARLLEVLARAMQLAHSRNVVHRDLKPGNILLAADGTPKISDFGLARHLDEDSGETQSGAVMGTPSYMAPEQAHGYSHAAGPAADIYALGAILYQCVAGRPPFKGQTVVETLDLVRTQEPAPPSRWRADVPLDLETICLKCLQKQPERRYASAAELADELARFQSGMPILARPVGRGEKSWRWCKRNPTLAVATALSIVALVVVTFVSVALASRERRHAEELGNALAASEEYRHEADRRLAESYLDRGITLCERGEHARGLLWLASGLEVAPADAVDLQHALRANLADWSHWLTPLRGVFEYPGRVALQVVSPDAHTVLIVNAEGAVELWDAASGRRIRELERAPTQIAAAFSSDGGTLVTLHRVDGSGTLWDAATGQPTGVTLPVHTAAKAVALGRGGKYVLTAGTDHIVRVWDGATGKPHVEFQPHALPIEVAQFSPDGGSILTASRTEARLWSVATGKPVGEPMPFSQGITATAFSRDGRFVVLGGWDRTAQVWSVADGRAVGPPIKHNKAVSVVALSPDGSVVFVGGDVTGRLWSVPEGKQLGPPLMQRNNLAAAIFSSDGQTLLTGGLEAGTRLWDVATGKPRGPELPQGQTVANIYCAAEGGGFLTESRDGVLRLWETADELPMLATVRVPDRLYAVGFEADATVAFTGGGMVTGEARLWDVASGRPRGEVLAHPSAVRTVALRADGKVLLTGCEDGTVRSWDVGTGKLLGPVLRHTARVNGVAFAADDAAIFTAASDNTLRRWDPKSGEPVGESWTQENQMLALAPSPDGRFVLVGCSDALGYLWPLDGRTAAPLRHRDWVIAVAVSPDGKVGLTGSDDTTARLWDTFTGKPIGPPLVHQNAVCAVAFSPDGKTVATGSEDNTARRWDLATGKPIGPPLVHPDWVLGVALRTDGRSIVTGCADRGLRVWKLPAAVEGTTERIRLWVQLHTGQELDASGAVRLLDAAEWRERAERLRDLGGPPGS